MRYWAGALGGAVVAVAVVILWVVRLMTDTSNPYRGENALGFVLVPPAAVLGAAVGVTVVMVWSGIRSREQATE